MSDGLGSVVVGWALVVGGLLAVGFAWVRWSDVVTWSLDLLRQGFLIPLAGAWVEVVRSVQVRVMSDRLGSLRQALVEVGRCRVGW